MSATLSRPRVEALAAKLSMALKEHYAVAPADDNVAVLEALNAFGLVVGVVIAGTGNSKHAKKFFRNAVNNQTTATLHEYSGMVSDWGEA